MNHAQRLEILDIAATAACWRSVFFGTDIFSKRALLEKEPSLAVRKFMYLGKEWYPLLLAAQQGDAEFVVELLDKGAKIDKVDETGNTALTRAIKAGHPEPLQDRYATTAWVLLEKGARIDLGRPSAAEYADDNSGRGDILSSISSMAERFSSDDEDHGYLGTGADVSPMDA